LPWLPVRGQRRTCYAQVGFWYQPAGAGNTDDIIHLAIPGLVDGHIAIRKDPAKANGHPRLFKLLDDALTDVGAPSPSAPSGSLDETCVSGHS